MVYRVVAPNPAVVLRRSAVALVRPHMIGLDLRQVIGPGLRLVIGPGLRQMDVRVDATGRRRNRRPDPIYLYPAEVRRDAARGYTDVPLLGLRGAGHGYLDLVRSCQDGGRDYPSVGRQDLRGVGRGYLCVGHQDLRGVGRGYPDVGRLDLDLHGVGRGCLGVDRQDLRGVGRGCLGVGLCRLEGVDVVLDWDRMAVAWAHTHLRQHCCVAVHRRSWPGVLVWATVQKGLVFPGALVAVAVRRVRPDVFFHHHVLVRIHLASYHLSLLVDSRPWSPVCRPRTRL